MALGILRGQSHQSTESDDPLIRLNKLVYCGRFSETTSSLRNTEISEQLHCSVSVNRVLYVVSRTPQRSVKCIARDSH